MSGTIQGGKQAAKTNTNLYGDDFYTVIGAKGGSISRGGGFTGKRELASIWGKVGGSISRRGKEPVVSERVRLRREARQKLQELSDSQVISLSQKHGQQRPW